MYYHVTVICPGPELHETFLLVKGEELDINLAGRLVNSRRVPSNSSRIVKNRFCHDGYLIIAVSAENSKKMNIICTCFKKCCKMPCILEGTIINDLKTKTKSFGDFSNYFHPTGHKC